MCYKHHLTGSFVPVVVFGTLAVMMRAMIKEDDEVAFLADRCIVSMLVAAFAPYPVVSPASTDPARDLAI